MVCECTGWDGPTEGGHLWRGELEQLIAEYPGTRFVLSHLRRRGTVAGAILAHDLLSLDVSGRRVRARAAARAGAAARGAGASSATRRHARFRARVVGARAAAGA